VKCRIHLQFEATSYQAVDEYYNQLLLKIDKVNRVNNRHNYCYARLAKYVQDKHTVKVVKINQNKLRSTEQNTGNSTLQRWLHFSAREVQLPIYRRGMTIKCVNISSLICRAITKKLPFTRRPRRSRPANACSSVSGAVLYDTLTKDHIDAQLSLLQNCGMLYIRQSSETQSL
jgi:hypothetical protein